MAGITSQTTNEDVRIAQNREKMGVLLLRKKKGSQGLSSGSIVNVVKSKHFPIKSKKPEWCILTVLPPGDFRVDDYFIECSNSETHNLSKIAQSSECYRPQASLALIPVQPTMLSRFLSWMSLKSSVFDSRRTFPTEYYNEGEESECRSEKTCFIVGSYESRKDSWTAERFTLITEKDDQGQVIQYELRAVDGNIFRTYDDIKKLGSHLYPRGAVILKGEGPQVTCIGVLNFSNDEIKKISPVFFTPESLTGEVQLYYPTVLVPGCPEGRTEVNASIGTRGQNLATEGDDYDEGPPNDELTTFLDDYTLQQWPKLSIEKTDECDALKQHESELSIEKTDECDALKQHESEQDQQTIHILTKRNAELRNNMKKTEQENEELREEMGDLRKINEDLRTENKELRVEKEGLRKERQTESYLREDNRQLRTENQDLREEWRKDSKELRAGNKELRAKNDEIRAENGELHAENVKLRAENQRLRAENDGLRAKDEE